MPKANDHHQFSICRLLTIEKMISERPPNKNDNANNTDSASRELAGEAKATKLTITKNNPTNNGIYQFLTVFLIEFKRNASMFYIFSVYDFYALAHFFDIVNDSAIY